MQGDLRQGYNGGTGRGNGERDLIFIQNPVGSYLKRRRSCLQWKFARDFFKACKAAGIHTALDTCGFVKPGNLKSVLAYSDLVLYDSGSKPGYP